MTTRIAVLGLGEMGTALASATLDSGRPVVVWNRTPRRTRSLAGRGAAVAASVRAAVTWRGPIVVCLSNHRSVHDVLDSVAGQLSGRTVINLTTTTPHESGELAGWTAERGVTYLDGVIMTTAQLIGAPDSTILFSGSSSAFTAHRSLLESWGTCTYLGPDARMASLYHTAMLSNVPATRPLSG